MTTADLDSLMPYFDAGRAGGFDAGVEQMVAAILVSPEFLFRAIKAPETVRLKPDTTGTTVFPLSDLELASRLSFFLWSQGPDDRLLTIAAAGKLRAPEMRPDVDGGRAPRREQREEGKRDDERDRAGGEGDAAGARRGISGSRRDR